MIRPLLLASLSLLASTAGAENLVLRVPVLETMEVKLRSADSAVTPNVEKGPDWLLPRHAGLGCGCRGFGFGISRPPPRPAWDPLGQLAELFLAGENFEIWVLERAVDTRDRMPGFWGAYAYRDTPITTVARLAHGMQPQWVFARLVDGLTRGDDPYDYEVWFFEEPTVAEAIDVIRFKPDYVVTIGCAAGLRFEVDRLERLLLVQSRERWSLIKLPVAELEYLSVVLETCIRGADAAAKPTHLMFDESAHGRSAEIAVQNRL